MLLNVLMKPPGVFISRENFRVLEKENKCYSVRRVGDLDTVLPSPRWISIRHECAIHLKYFWMPDDRPCQDCLGQTLGRSLHRNEILLFLFAQRSACTSLRHHVELPLIERGQVLIYLVRWILRPIPLFLSKRMAIPRIRQQVECSDIVHQIVRFAKRAPRTYINTWAIFSSQCVHEPLFDFI